MSLVVKNLSVQFGELRVLKNLSLSVTRGEMVGIVGPNGCGKTTFFNAVSGFVPIQSGTIALDGNSLQDRQTHARAELGVGRTFQNFGVFRDLTVLENMAVAMPRLRAKDIKRNAMELLREYGLDVKLSNKAGSLSGGQMRLLEIARLKAMGATMLLLDEPTAGVSPKMKGQLIEVIGKLRTDGATVLIIEHDMRFIEKLCSRIVLLNEGVVALDGPPQEVRQSPVMQEVYFGKGEA